MFLRRVVLKDFEIFTKTHVLESIFNKIQVLIETVSKNFKNVQNFQEL